MKEHFSDQVQQNREIVFYFIEHLSNIEDVPHVELVMKNLKTEELDSFDFSDFEFVRLSTRFIYPVFKSKIYSN